MAKGDDERVRNMIDQSQQTQQTNAAAQTGRTNQANDIFYGSPQTQQQTSGPINSGTAAPSLNGLPQGGFFGNLAKTAMNTYNQQQGGAQGGQGGQTSSVQPVGTGVKLDASGNTVSSAAPQGGGQGGAAQVQGGGAAGPEPSYNSKDPASVDAYIAWMQKQPGVNPSVINDPGYWRGKMLADTNAGGLGPDASYIKGKMMTPEGAPAGGGSAPGTQPGGPGGVAGQQIAQQGDVYNRYSQFADTGGFSPTDLQNIRARALSPVKAIYANAQANANRSKSLQGGYSPGMNVANARLAREQGQATSDAATGAESNIAQMVQQGKLAGMGGMSGIYSATPGMASTFGNQALGQEQLQLGQQGSQQNITGQQQNKANAERGSVLRNTLGVAKIGAAVAGI